MAAVGAVVVRREIRRRMFFHHLMNHPPGQLLKTVCAWCEKERGESARKNVTHGICQRHAAAVLKSYGLRIVREMDDSPASIVFSNSKNLAAVQAAQEGARLAKATPGANGAGCMELSRFVGGVNPDSSK